ncbi:ABC transporter ATP-binding protein [Ferrovibrio sp.]|uniref:ABC transporter ATP-binding protein n=1 Tax=Ferrovibrio sp. TaxID=1917215 RepID=UPI0035B4CE7C
MLDILHLSKTYGSAHALTDVSFSINKGSFTTILGPSGSGKSTLLLNVAGFVAPTSGDIRLEGRSLLDVSAEKRNFGIVFQGYALFPHLRVRENVAFPLRMRGLSKADIEKKVKQALELVQLQPYAERYPRELSGGQQQRVALARALVFDPSLVLLDEPLSALDKSLRDSLREELRHLHKAVGMTFILVTHDQDEALELSDSVAIINNGRLEQFADPATLYNAPASRFVAEFLGKSNFIPVQAASGAPDAMTLQAAGQNLRHSQHAPLPGNASNNRMVLALRPERIRLVNGHGVDGDANVVVGEIVDLSYRGADIGAAVRTDLGLLNVRLDTGGLHAMPRIGERVKLSWSTSAGFLLPDDGAQ